MAGLATEPASLAGLLASATGADGAGGNSFIQRKRIPIEITIASSRRLSIVSPTAYVRAESPTLG
jgi:hypothetical protein